MDVITNPCTNSSWTILTPWGRVTHICVSKLATIGSDNGLSSGRRQDIIWSIAGILMIGPLGTNFGEILIEILTFSFKKMRLKVSSAKRRPFCIGLNGLIKGAPSHHLAQNWLCTVHPSNYACSLLFVVAWYGWISFAGPQVGPMLAPWTLLSGVKPQADVRGRDKWLHPISSVGCKYLSLPLTPASGATPLVYDLTNAKQLTVKLCACFMSQTSQRHGPRVSGFYLRLS